MSKFKVISKFTLVPVSVAVAFGIAGFLSANYLMADKIDLVLIKQKHEALRSEFDSYKTTSQSQIDGMGRVLNRIDKNVAVIANAVKVEIDGGS